MGLPKDEIRGVLFLEDGQPPEKTGTYEKD